MVERIHGKDEVSSSTLDQGSKIILWNCRLLLKYGSKNVTIYVETLEVN